MYVCAITTISEFFEPNGRSANTRELCICIVVSSVMDSEGGALVEILNIINYKQIIVIWVKSVKNNLHEIFTEITNIKTI